MRGSWRCCPTQQPISAARNRGSYFLVSASGGYHSTRSHWHTVWWLGARTPDRKGAHPASRGHLGDAGHTMSNQALQKSLSKRRGRTTAAKGVNVVRRPSTRLEGRRDGKPLLFGWGRHLTRKQKTQIQMRAAYTFVSIVAVAVVGVFI